MYKITHRFRDENLASKKMRLDASNLIMQGYQVRVMKLLLSFTIYFGWKYILKNIKKATI
ncbi:hypothetical protein BCU94_10170 [Shewanella sp. 10N.286.52.C2]|nr:hypothetical protein BCU94_10170 [Shewanella sp. 10N.286.52.C2]PMG51222.1 hypothetical protein BCU91_16715 [Shewanella sp. 10N.286.52.B9]